MRYDFYSRDRLYKPGLAKQCRNRLHRKVLEGLPLRSVCEIGVGFGEFAEYCRQNGIEWLGIEPNDHLREALEAQGFLVYNAMMPQFPEVNERMDAIFASHMIEHLNGLPEALRFLAGCEALLRDKGGRYLVLLYPDIQRCGNMFWFDYTHNFVTSKSRIEQMLLDNGWKIRKSGHYTACFFRISPLLRIIGKVFPYFLLPRRIAEFARLSFQEHAYTVAELKDVN